MAGDALKKRKKNRVSSSSPIPIEVDDTDTDKGKNDKDKDQDKDKDDGRDEWLPAPDDSDVESAVTDEEFDDPDQGYEVGA
jgi:hypothetical protein